MQPLLAVRVSEREIPLPPTLHLDLRVIVQTQIWTGSVCQQCFLSPESARLRSSQDDTGAMGLCNKEPSLKLWKCNPEWFILPLALCVTRSFVASTFSGVRIQQLSILTDWQSLCLELQGAQVLPSVCRPVLFIMKFTSALGLHFFKVVSYLLSLNLKAVERDGVNNSQRFWAFTESSCWIVSFSHHVLGWGSILCLCFTGKWGNQDRQTVQTYTASIQVASNVLDPHSSAKRPIQPPNQFL